VPEPTPRLIVLVGLPGSGKSTWVREHGLPAISSDRIRGWLMDDETDQTVHNRVFGLVRNLLRQRLELRRPVTCIDATNITRRERRPYIITALRYGALPEAVFFDVPAAVCRQRNGARARYVPDGAIEAMAARLVPPSLDEGFHRVTVIR
jgi:predicted kinase